MHKNNGQGLLKAKNKPFIAPGNDSPPWPAQLEICDLTPCELPSVTELVGFITKPLFYSHQI